MVLCAHCAAADLATGARKGPIACNEVADVSWVPAREATSAASGRSAAVPALRHQSANATQRGAVAGEPAGMMELACSTPSRRA